MLCAEYEDWVAADVDGRAGERAQEIAEHLRGCASCRDRRAAQAAVRTLLRTRQMLEPAPLGLATRIRARLDEEAAGRASRSWFGLVRAGALGLAAAGLALALSPPGASGDLAEIAESLRRAEAAAVAMPAEAPTELAEGYAEGLGRQDRPVVLDLGPKLRLVGGSIAELRGAPARITHYRSANGWVICHLVPAAAWRRLAARLEGGSFFVSVQGVHLKVTRAGDEICVLASRLPVAEFRALVSPA